MNLLNKYRNDKAFQMLVDMLESFIYDNRLTPAEVREASMLACINYEMRQISPRTWILPEIENAIDKLDRYRKENHV